MIERNLVDVLALLASIEARDEISALVDTPTRIEARHETRCEETTSTSLHSKKKEARKLESLLINNECIEKALIQLTGAVKEVGYILKCILVVLAFFGEILVMYFHVPKINDEKKICVCKEKCTRPGCVRALGARPPHPRNGPDTTDTSPM